MRILLLAASFILGGLPGLTAPAPASAAVTAPATKLAAASPYLQPVASIPHPKGCAPLRNGINGVKVKLVQRRLGLPKSYWENYDRRTVELVKKFQRKRGLPADGVVGPKTWRALGLKRGFCLDRYRAPIAVPADATQAQRTKQFLKYVKSFHGVEYVWGGAGRGRDGVDCSGLVLQGLYSAGLNPAPITLDKHVLRDYRTSKELYAHPKLQRLPLAQAKPGDLVFWGRKSTGVVNHVAIYVGNGKVFEAVSGPNKVRYGTVGNRSTQNVKPFVVRPFPEA